MMLAPPKVSDTHGPAEVINTSPETFMAHYTASEINSTVVRVSMCVCVCDREYVRVRWFASV